MRFKVYIYLVLLALVSLTYSVNTPKLPISTILAQVNDTPFGKSIGSLIQLTLETEEPNEKLNAISTLLNDLAKTVDSLLNSSNSSINEKRNYCQFTEDDLNSQVKDLKTQKQDSESEKEALLEEQSEKQQNLQDERQNLENMQTDLQNNQQELDTENSDFEIKFADYDTLIIACEEGIKLLTRMIHGEDNLKYNRQGTAFVELADMKSQLEKQVEKFQSHSRSPMIEPVITVLTTMASKSKLNYENVINCIELIQTLINNLRSAQMNLKLRHEQLSTDLTNLISNLEQWIPNSLLIIDIYEERLQEIKDRIDELQNVLSELNQFIGTNQDVLNGVQEDCESVETAWRTQNAQLLSSKATIQKLIDYFSQEVTSTVSNVN